MKLGEDVLEILIRKILLFFGLSKTTYSPPYVGPPSHKQNLKKMKYTQKWQKTRLDFQISQNKRSMEF